MSVKLQKEHIKISEIVCSKYCQTTVESDIIVPDVKPDILKILQADSEVTINRRYIQNERVFVQGTVRLNILYVPDNGISGTVKSICTMQEFSHSVDIPEAEGTMDVSVDAECEPAEYTLVNSRKLSVRSRVAFCIRLMAAKEFDIATGVEEEQAVEIKCRPMKLYNPCIDVLRDIIIRERLEVPAGKPAIAEVLKFSAKAYHDRLQIGSDKVSAKGELKVCVLYCGEEEGSAPEVMEHTIPFSEVLEIDGLHEGMTIEPDYRVKDCYYEICQDSDGDSRILSCEFSIEASVRAFETVELRTLEDAYSQKVPVEIKKTELCLEQLVGSGTEVISLKEAVNVPDYLPEVHRLCECTASPTVESVAICEASVEVKGYLTCSFLYLSNDAAQPASGFSHILPFSHTFALDGATPDTVCDAKADAEHIVCTISGGKALEVRANICLSIKATHPAHCEAVSEIVPLEEEAERTKASMVVYFVQKGDTLWDIAKRYRISEAAILSANGAESEIIKPGKCIYIFK
ncbi:MAG: DUF3794 domain-containing protein [Clostridia bacterium]|nr:DUF3794 domain-containing protein [Clostridia bacterium]